LVTALKPEEYEWLAALCFRDLHHSFKVYVPLSCVALVDVGEESEDADDSTFALVSVDCLLDKLMYVWLNVSLVEQIVGEGTNASSFTRTLVRLLVLSRFTLAIVPVIDGGVA